MAWLEYSEYIEGLTAKLYAIKMLVPRRLSSSAASGKCLREPVRLAKGAGTLIRGDSGKRGQQDELKRREQRGRSMKNSPSKGKR